MASQWSTAAAAANAATRSIFSAARAENIKRALDAELYFYSKVFGFDLADPVEPVAIENL